MCHAQHTSFDFLANEVMVDIDVFGSIVIARMVAQADVAKVVVLQR